MEPAPFSISALTTSLARGEYSAEAVAGDMLQRCEHHRKLRALIAQDPEQVLSAARAADRWRAAGKHLGPLHGVPILIKDNIDVLDYPTTAGTPGLAGVYPDGNAPVVQRLLDAGAIVAGKANLHELAVGGTSQNEHFGHVINPWRAEVVAGGSSGGSAVAVAARLIPGALGTDTNGSVRGPCAMNGIVGLRPSFHRYPYGGIFPSTPTRDSVGGIATTMADLILLDAVLAGEPLRPPDTLSLKELRIGRPAGDYNTVLDARTAEVMDEAVQLLSDAGATVVCEDLPGMHGTAWPISAYEVVAHVMDTLTSRHPPVALDSLVSQIASAHVRERFNPQIANLVKLERPYHEAMEILRPRLQAQLATYFREHRLDALIFPTTPFPAMAVADDGADVVINGKHVAHGFSYVIHNTVYQSAAGIPSLTVPAGLTADGLPVGISFDGPMGSDRRLLAIGLAFETLRGPFPLPAVAERSALRGTNAPS